MNTSTFTGSLCVALFIAVNHSWAAIRPSFMLDYSAWHATDIVVASEGDTVDGNLSVLDVWKGCLTPRKALSLPALAAFAEEKTRTVSSFWASEDDSVPPAIMSARRMILFLRRAIPVERDDQRLEAVQWLPASRFGGMKVSTVWIERGNAYAFTQVINPGPSILIRQGFSESEIKKRASEINQIQESLKKIAADPDPGGRAKRVTPYVRSDVYFVRKEAFRLLAECRTPAVPILRSLLADKSNATQYGDIIDAMAAAGGPKLGQEFSKIVVKEFEFWKVRAPSLKVGWWNGKGLEWKEVNVLRNRYSKILHVFYGLRQMGYEGSRSSVRSFRDFWRSLPQLEDKSGLDQMSQACDAVLKVLDEKKVPSNKPGAGSNI
ncbi:hypothetical protein ACFL5Z_14510 [Planctomycetota bacterium]